MEKINGVFMNAVLLIPLSVGIETTVVFWPVRLKESGRVLFFRFELWDCGESAMRRFDHMLLVSSSISYTV